MRYFLAGLLTLTAWSAPTGPGYAQSSVKAQYSRSVSVSGEFDGQPPGENFSDVLTDFVTGDKFADTGLKGASVGAPASIAQATVSAYGGIRSPNSPFTIGVLASLAATATPTNSDASASAHAQGYVDYNDQWVVYRLDGDIAPVRVTAQMRLVGGLNVTTPASPSTPFETRASFSLEGTGFETTTGTIVRTGTNIGNGDAAPNDVIDFSHVFQSGVPIPIRLFVSASASVQVTGIHSSVPGFPGIPGSVSATSNFGGLESANRLIWLGFTSVIDAATGAPIAVEKYGFGSSSGFDFSGAFRYWTNPSGGLHSEEDNWAGGIPVGQERAVFALPGAYSVEIAGNPSYAGASFIAGEEAHVTLDVTSGAYAVDSFTIAGGNHVHAPAGGIQAGVVYIGTTEGDAEASWTLAGPMHADAIAVGGSAVVDPDEPTRHYQTPGGQGRLKLDPGANLEVTSLLTNNGGEESAIEFNGGTLTVRGLGRFSSDEPTFSRVGDGVHTATLNLYDSADPGFSDGFTFGDHALTIAENAVVNFDAPDHLLTVGEIRREGSGATAGVFNWVAGAIEYDADEIDISPTGPFGAHLVLNADCELDSFAEVTIAAGSSLTVAGGIVRADSFAGPGQIIYTSGTIRSAAGSPAVSLGDANAHIDQGKVVELEESTLTVGAGQKLTINGGELRVGKIEGAGRVDFNHGDLIVEDDDLSIGPTGNVDSGSSLDILSGSSIQARRGTVTLLPSQLVTIEDNGLLRAKTLQVNTNVMVDSGQIVAASLRIGGAGGAGSVRIMDEGDLVCGRIGRNNLVIDDGEIRVTEQQFDPADSDPVLDNSIVGGYTSDSAMTMNGGRVETPNMKIGVAAPYTDTVVINGGTLETANLWAAGGARSNFTFNGGRIQSEHSEIDGPSSFVVGNGVSLATFQFQGGTHSFAKGLSISTSGRVFGDGIIVGNVTNNGELCRDNDREEIAITGNLTNAGFLRFDVSDTEFFDEIQVSGNFAAGGIIALNTIDPELEIGDVLDLMDFGSFVDNGMTFDFSRAQLPLGLAWDVSSFSTTGSVSIVAGANGDFDGSGSVDAGDFAAWQAGFGAAGSATLAQGDSDSDQDVDGDDFLAWQKQFGASSTGGGEGEEDILAVPEPGSLSLTLALVALAGTQPVRRPPQIGNRARQPALRTN